jgi:hypothetical protein
LISVGENITYVARMPGHQSPAVTRGKYSPFIPNLIRTGGKALLEKGKIAIHCTKQGELLL